MTQRVNKNLSLLKTLHQCSLAEQKNILKSARPELVNAICDCILNILQGNVPISTYHKRKLKAKKDILRKLVHPRKNSSHRKKLLVQHGAGFLTSILGPVLKAIAGTVLNL